MNDLKNEYSDEDRQRISKDAADIINQINNMPGDNFTCGVNKGIEKILICQLDKSNLKKVLDETSSIFKASNLNSIKYSITSGESILAEDGALYSQIYIQPKQPVFFNSKVGNKKDIELVALTITVQLLTKDTDIKLEILSHFNPDIFRNVKIEYSGIVTTGVNRHLQLVLPESIATEELKNNIISGLNESISYYFK